MQSRAHRAGTRRPQAKAVGKPRPLRAETRPARTPTPKQTASRDSRLGERGASGQSEEKYRELVTEISEGIFLTDDRGTLMFANPALADILGVEDPHQLVGRNFIEFVAPSGSKTVAGYFRQAIETGRTREMIVVDILRADATNAVVEIRSTPIMADGRVTGMQGVLRDITERKAAEEHLRASEVSLQGILRSTADGILGVNSENKVLYANERFMQMWGIPQAVMATGDDSVLIKHVLEQLTDPEAFLKKVEQLYKSEKESLDTLYFKDGRVFDRRSRPLMQDQELKGRVWSFRDVTERKRADAALQESEAHLRGLFEDSPISLWEQDFSRVKLRLDSLRQAGVTNFERYFEAHPEVVRECAALVRVLDVNRATLTIYGAPRKEDLLESLDQVLEGSALEDFRRELVKIAAGEFYFTWEGRNKTLDGRLIDVDLNWSVVPGHEKSLSRVIVAAIDITERKRAAEALRTAEEKYRTIFENSIEGVFQSTLEGRFLTVNPAFAHMLGYASPQDMIETVTDIARQVYLESPRREEFVGSMEQHGSVNAFEFQMLRKDGSTLWVSENVRTVRNAEGALLYFEGTVVDVTARKRAEEALRESEERLHALFDNAMIGMYRTTPDGRILLANPAAIRLLGFDSLEDLATRNLEQGGFDTDYPRNKFRETMETEGTVIGLERTWKRKDGAIIFIRESATAVRDPDGKTLYYDGTFEDITERKQAQILQEAVYRIAAAAETAGSLDDLYPQIHQAISSVMPAENFYITIYDQDQDVLRFPYFKDLNDEPFVGGVQPGKGLTAYVLRTGNSLLCTQAVHDELERLGEVKLLGVPSAIWLGVPLIVEGKSIGAMVVQHYSDPKAYGEREQHMLEFVSTQVALAIDRKQTEEARREGERRFREMLENAALIAIMLDSQGRLTFCNDYLLQLTGRSRAEVLGQNWFAMFVPSESSIGIVFNEGMKQETIVPHFENDILTASGARRTVSWNNTLLRNTEGDVIGVASLGEDITERTRAEQASRLAEEKYRSIFENSLEEITQTTPEGRFLDANPAAIRMLGYASRDELIAGFGDLATKFYVQPYRRQEFMNIMDQEGTVSDFESEVYRRDGSTRWISENSRAVRRVDGSVAYYEGTAQDITDRRQAQILQEAVYRIAAAAETTESLDDLYPQIHEIISSVMQAQNFYITIYDAAQDLLRFPYFKDADDEPFVAGVQPGKGLTAYVLRTGRSLLCTQAVHDELERLGEVKLLGVPSAIWLGVPLIVEGQTIGAMVVQHYSDPKAYGEREQHVLEFVSTQVALAINRKQAEELIRRRADEFAALYETTHGLSASYELAGLLQTISESAVKLLKSNSAAIYMYDAAADELELAVKTGFPVPLGTRLKMGEGMAGRVAQSREPMIVDDYQAWQPHSAQYAGVPFRAVVEVPMLAGGNLLGVLAVTEFGDSLRKYTDADVRLLSLFAGPVAIAIANTRLYEEAQNEIAERKRSEQKTLAHLRRLAALRSIDTAISSTFDLRVTLNFLLQQVTLELGVDAAAVLVLDRDIQELTCAANRGFRGSGITGLRLRLGQDYAGRVALERRSIFLPNISLADPPFRGPGAAKEESFVAYYAAPLIAKGQVKGVLEVFHRSSLNPDSDWTDFLETLAAQTAIAMDNDELFGDLQQSNAEMLMAYDRTIEGWSRAMDLRDKETEGHSLRVTAMTLELARAMQIRESELPHIRRGALLHDIGKLAVPDAILLKPDQLTPEEWVIMRQHPTHAYEMLSPIAYLRAAIDIPYCHHEKWDGTGYPRGLRGEEIPLDARIFAVVDVWDALTSDRPYQPAWSKERALEYIRSESGTHFDPQAVRLFLESGIADRPERDSFI